VSTVEPRPDWYDHTQLRDILRKALRSSSESITITRLSDGRFVDVNERFEKLTGYSRGEVVGKTSLELELWRDPADRARVEDLLAANGAARDFEADFIVSGGEIRHCLLAAEVLEIEGERCMLATVRDVTDVRRAQEAVQWFSERLRNERRSRAEKEAALKQILEHLAEEKSAIRSEVASQLNSLLEPIVGQLRSGATLDETELDRLERHLERIVGAGMEGDQPDFSRLTAREMDICAAIKNGLSSKEIADQFGLSVNTVHKHRQGIRRKLQLSNRDVNLAAFLRSR
jgi:PAS domain S-box-containing protein